MEKLAIGVDVGTTQAKAVAFQANGTVVASSYVRYPLIQETEGMAEQDPETLFQAVVNCIRTVTQQVKNQPIGLISFASAMHGLIAMDAQGRPLTQVITWADTRASDYAEALKETPAAQLFYQLTGMPVHPMAPLYQPLRRARPSLLGLRTTFFTVSLANTGQIIVVLRGWVYLIFTRGNGNRRF